MASSILGDLFKRDWTLGQLLRVDSGRADRGSGCKVVLVDTYSEIIKETVPEKFKKFFTRRKDIMNVYYVIFKFKVTSETGSTYTVLIRCQSDFEGTEYMDNKIQIYCQCADFMYRSAYVLNQHGALFRSNKTDQALGASIVDAPKEKSLKSTLCKHSYAAVTYLMRNYEDLMKNI